MRSLVELTFHLSIRKIRQTDFPKLCSEHLATVSANRSSWTLQHLWNLAAYLWGLHLAFSHQKNQPQASKILLQRIKCVRFHLIFSWLIKRPNFSARAPISLQHSSRAWCY